MPAGLGNRHAKGPLHGLRQSGRFGAGIVQERQGAPAADPAGKRLHLSKAFGGDAFGGKAACAFFPGKARQPALGLAEETLSPGLLPLKGKAAAKVAEHQGILPGRAGKTASGLGIPGLEPACSLGEAEERAVGLGQPQSAVEDGLGLHADHLLEHALDGGHAVAQR